MNRIGSVCRRCLYPALGLIWATIILSSPPVTFAQTTISTGSIQGTVTDASGAVVPGSSIELANQASGQTVHFATNSAGAWTSGALLLGDYLVRVSAKGFRNEELPVLVQVGVTSHADVRLEVGEATSTITVESSAEQVNTARVIRRRSRRWDIRQAVTSTIAWNGTSVIAGN